MKIRARLEVVFAGLAALSLALAFLAPGLPPGMAPVSTDPLYADAEAVPYRAVRPPEFQASNPFLSDQANVFYPWMRFMSAAVRRGELPLWSPESSGGQPFMANLSAALFFPTTWLSLLPPDLLSAARGMLYGAILRLFVAGFFGYLLLRRVAVGRPAAAAGGIGMMLFGYHVVWQFYSLANVACLIPLCLYLVQRFAERATISAGMAMAAALAMQFLGGHAETSLALAILCVLWFAGAVKSGIAPRTWPAMWARFSVFGAVSIALCSFQILPFLDYLIRSQGRAERADTHPPTADVLGLGTIAGVVLVIAAALCAAFAGRILRRAASSDRASCAAWPRVLRMGGIAGVLAAAAIALWTPLGLRITPLLLLDPDLFGSPLGVGGYRGPEFYPDVVGGYAGAFLLFLAAVAVVASRRRELVGAVAAAGGFALAMDAHIQPIYGLVKRLPPFDIAADSRMLPLLGIAIPILGAFALDEARAAPRALVRSGLRVLVAALVGAGLLVGLGALDAGRVSSRLVAPRVADSGDDPRVSVVSPDADERFRPVVDSRRRGRIEVPIQIDVPEGGELELRVGTGTLFRGRVPGGRFSMVWDASRIPIGEYVIAPRVLLPDGEQVEGAPRAIRIDREPEVSGRSWLRVALVIVLAFAALWWAGTPFVWVAPVVVAAELFLFGFAYNTYVPESSVFPPTDLTDFLASERAARTAEGKGPPRILCEDAILQPNQHYAYDLHLIRGYDQMEVRDFHRILPVVLGGASRGALNRRTIRLSSPWLAWLGVAYVVTGERLDQDGFELAYEGRDGFVYRNRAARPRAFLADRAVDFLTTPAPWTLDPMEAAIVEGTPPALGGGGTATIDRYRLNEVQVSTEADGPSLLVLTDNMFPGWTAEVDGEAAPIRPVAFAFRGVEVPAGKSVVVFRYHARGFLPGLLLAAVTLLLWVLLASRGRPTGVVRGQS